MNVADAQSAEFSPNDWRDTHVRIEGTAVWALQRVFLEDWFFAAQKQFEWSADYFPAPSGERRYVVQVVASGPDHDHLAIHRTYFTVMTRATRRLWVTTPYFVPDEATAAALSTAALRGVDVRLLIPRRGDSRLIDLAARSYVPELVAAGVRVYEYGPRFIHAKTIVVDDDLAIVGSANLDNRSFLLNFEVTSLITTARSPRSSPAPSTRTSRPAARLTPPSSRARGWDRSSARRRPACCRRCSDSGGGVERCGQSAARLRAPSQSPSRKSFEGWLAALIDQVVGVADASVIQLMTRCTSVDEFIDRFARFTTETDVVVPAVPDVHVGTTGQFVIRLGVSIGGDEGALRGDRDPSGQRGHRARGCVGARADAAAVARHGRAQLRDSHALDGTARGRRQAAAHARAGSTIGDPDADARAAAAGVGDAAAGARPAKPTGAGARRAARDGAGGERERCGRRPLAAGAADGTDRGLAGAAPGGACSGRGVHAAGEPSQRSPMPPTSPASSS